ncbi:hypothetical protein VULLAG_LOCUS3681 [Vulpes lagopus]
MSQELQKLEVRMVTPAPPPPTLPVVHEFQGHVQAVEEQKGSGVQSDQSRFWAGSQPRKPRTSLSACHYGDLPANPPPPTPPLLHHHQPGSSRVFQIQNVRLGRAS